MAHGEKLITSTRTVRLGTLYRDHDQEGRNFDEASTIEYDGARWLAVRDSDDHGLFHLRAARGNSESGYNPTQSEQSGTLYRPIHPSTKFEDIDGATHAWDDGTHWHFAHCSPDEQVDFAAEVRTFTIQQFAPAIAKAQVKIVESTNSVLRAREIAETKALIEFSERAGKFAYDVVLKETLGHFHRDPHHDHKREQALEAITVMLSAWAEGGKVNVALLAKHAAVRTHVTAVQSSLSTTHVIERRPTRAARLAAEAEAAKQAAENQGQ